MTKKQYFRLVSSVLIVPFVAAFLLVSQAEAAQGVQGFKVTVPGKLTITPPVSEVSIEHSDTDTDQVFPVQEWDVKARARSGASVSFATSTPFTNASDSTYMADATLDLEIGSSQAKANWAVSGSGTDSTDYAGGNDDAVVQAASTKAGKATFNLTVTFKNDPEGFEALAEGDYELTVTGTLTAN